MVEAGIHTSREKKYCMAANGAVLDVKLHDKQCTCSTRCLAAFSASLNRTSARALRRNSGMYRAAAMRSVENS